MRPECTATLSLSLWIYRPLLGPQRNWLLEAKTTARMGHWQEEDYKLVWKIVGSNLDSNQSFSPVKFRLNITC